MEEWKEYKALDFCYNVTDGTHDSPKPKDEGRYLITSKHLKDGYIDFATANKISEEDYQKIIQRSKVEQFDILYSMIGTIGNIYRVVDDKVDFAVKNMGIFKMGGDQLKSKWLYYWLKTPLAKEYVNSRLAGSTQSYMTLKSLREFPVYAPDEDKINKIINILSSLDDKIEVNRRINEQLEELAQALFKSWFVDFEPFKDGEFVESELGMIPEGWKVGTLGDVCEKITDGSHYSPKDNPKSIIPMLSVKDMQKYSFDYSKSKHIDEEEYAKMKSNDCVPLVNDILVAKDGSYLKEIFICKKEIKQAILSSIAIFRANKSIIYPMILLCILKSPRTLKNVSENFVSGSALPRIVLKDFKRYSIVFPPLEIQSGLNDKICAIYDKIYANEEEITHLTNLRDTLLPKLMSGEIDVNQVEI